MKRLTKEQQRHLVRIWQTAGPELERIRREELRGLPYKWEDVDMLLDMGDYYDGPPRLTSGLVEMQRLFVNAARKQGLLPSVVREEPAAYGRAPLHIVGDAAILDRPKVALFCSVKCPGKLILDTYDLAKRFRDEGVTVISGFHSPMEQECLRILLRSPHPVIWCLARGLYRQIPSTPVDCRPAAAEGRLVMVTPFPHTVRHITEKTATTRNRLVAEMASAVIVAHAAPGSKMEALCRDILANGKPLYTFDHPANAALIQAGAKSVDTLDLADWHGRGHQAKRRD